MFEAGRYAKVFMPETPKAINTTEHPAALEKIVFRLKTDLLRKGCSTKRHEKYARTSANPLNAR
jgi:hypothetical protein